MLERDERDMLRRIEWHIATGDPQLAARLRAGQRRLQRGGTRTGFRVMTALLVLLAVALLVLGLPGSAVAVVALATGLWWLRRWRIGHQEA